MRHVLRFQYQADRQRQPAGQAGVGRTRDERNEYRDRPPETRLTTHTETSATCCSQFWHSRFVSDTLWHGAHAKCGHPLTKNMGSRAGSVRVNEGRRGGHGWEEARVQYAAAAETSAVLPPPTTSTRCPPAINPIHQEVAPGKRKIILLLDLDTPPHLASGAAAACRRPPPSPCGSSSR